MTELKKKAHKTMTELKKKAHKSWENDTTVSGASMPNKIYEAGYIAGATEATKALKAQIEKMKLCANCKHCGVSGWCDKLNRYLLDKANQSCGNWEIKEK